MRRYLDKSIYLEVKQEFIHRKKILDEILETEESYIKCLEVIIKVYKEQLIWKASMAEQMKEKKPMITDKEIGIIFSNVSAIFECNKNLLEELRDRLSNSTSNTKVGDIFISYAPYFKVYTQYYNNYEASSSLLDKLRNERVPLDDFLLVSNIVII